MRRLKQSIPIAVCLLFLFVQLSWADLSRDLPFTGEHRSMLVVPALALALSVGLGLTWLRRRKSHAKSASTFFAFSMVSMALVAVSIAVHLIDYVEKGKQSDIQRQESENAWYQENNARRIKSKQDQNRLKLRDK